MFAISLAMGIAELWGLKVNASVTGSLMAFSSVGVLSLSLYLRQSLRRLPE
jgi:uncharacterized membrane protein YeiB